MKWKAYKGLSYYVYAMDIYSFVFREATTADEKSDFALKDSGAFHWPHDDDFVEYIPHPHRHPLPSVTNNIGRDLAYPVVN